MINKLFILIFTSTLLFACNKEPQRFYQTNQLREGFPDILKSLEKDLPFKIGSYAQLLTNNDSVDIYFGTLKQGDQSGSWLALASHNQIRQFTSFTFIHNSENEKENDIDIVYNNSEERVSVRIKELDTINNKITYAWINQTRLSDSLKVHVIDRPLVKGKIFPKIELADRDGKKIDLEDFKDQILVINWWAVWCAPCRAEIPGLNKLVDKYANQDIKFISITNDGVDTVSGFLEKNEFTYDITFITEESSIVFGNAYPKNIVIDASQIITYFSEGGNKDKWQEIDHHIQNLIN